MFFGQKRVFDRSCYTVLFRIMLAGESNVMSAAAFPRAAMDEQRQPDRGVFLQVFREVHIVHEVLFFVIDLIENRLPVLFRPGFLTAGAANCQD